MKIIVANLKMNFNLEENIVYKNTIEKFIQPNDNVIVCPSFPFLSFYNNGNYSLGAQTVSEYDKGPFTGEVGARDLTSLDVEYCLVGHYDRRKNFSEDGATIVTKINKLVENGITAILCIGETKEDKSSKKTLAVLQKQIIEIFNKISPEKYKKIIIAYEPIWAIGSGNICDTKKLNEVVTFIKNFMVKSYRTNITVLYGGSITEFNVGDLNDIPNLDGYLISSSIINPKSFESIISNCR